MTNTEKNSTDEKTTLGGVSREKCMLAAGYCMGLARSNRLPLDEHEADILEAAGKALRAAAERLYQPVGDAPAGMVKGEQLLESLYPNKKERPSLKWLSRMQKARQIPYVKLGRLIFFDLEQVREAIKNRHTVQPRKI